MGNPSIQNSGDSIRASNVEEVWHMIASVVDFELWHEVRNLLMPQPRLSERVSLDWLLPVLSYNLLTGESDDVQPAVTAMACAQLAIIIADDILDEEPGSLYTHIGVGRATNVSMALQAASHILLDQCQVTSEGLASAHLALSSMVLATAKGQELDSKNLLTEEDYWQILNAKSSPYYGYGLEMGARLACANQETTATFHAIGAALGEIIQIRDDLEDAFQIPANPDWIQGRNNLAILYALSTDHSANTKFGQLRLQAQDPSNLHQLQQILIDSGAVSFCIYQMYERRGSIYRLLESISSCGMDSFKPFIDSLLKPVEQFRFSFATNDQVEAKPPEP